MTIAAAVVYAFALAAEVRGVWLLQRERRTARDAIQRWRDANPERHEATTNGQTKQISGLMELLLGNDASRRNTIGLLLLGAVLGAVGNYLSLSW